MYKSIRTTAFWFFVLLIGSVCGQVLLAGCELQHEERAHVVSEAGPGPAQESWDVRYRISQVHSGEEDSRPRMHVVAGYMANFELEDSTYTLLEDPPSGEPESRTTAYLFTDEGDSSATITANRFLYFEDESRLRAEGNVIVVTTDERRLETEELIWLEDERAVEAPGFVSITTPEERVHGYDLIGDEDLETYELGRITGQFTVEDDT